MTCCEGWNNGEENVNGVCPDCGEPTVDGEAVKGCHHSSVLCETCGDAPCDESC